MSATHRSARVRTVTRSSERPTVRANVGENSIDGDDARRSTTLARVVDLAMASPLRKRVELALYFAGWYYFSIAFNVHQKTLLKAFPMPLTVTACELVIGACLAFVASATSGKRGMEMPTKSAAGAVTVCPCCVPTRRGCCCLSEREV